jgi:colicin import membrane protein
VSQPLEKSAFYLSLALHAVIVLVLIVSVEFSSQLPVVENADKNMKVISAVVMDNAEPANLPVPTKVANIQKIEPPTTNIKPTITPEQAAIAINLQRKKALAKQKDLMAKQLLADFKKEVAQQKKLKQKSIEAAFAKELREQSAKSLQKQLRQEQARIAGAKVQGEVNKYKALILQAISQRWIVPIGVDKKLYSELLIRLAPGGMVLDVQVTKSSGNVALDRSARDAVFKASPLPVPDAHNGFDQFRQFVLRVKPENVVINNLV